jgi:hypothetical protein
MASVIVIVPSSDQDLVARANVFSHNLKEMEVFRTNNSNLSTCSLERLQQLGKQFERLKLSVRTSYDYYVYALSSSGLDDVLFSKRVCADLDLSNDTLANIFFSRKIAFYSKH